MVFVSHEVPFPAVSDWRSRVAGNRTEWEVKTFELSSSSSGGEQWAFLDFPDFTVVKKTVPKLRKLSAFILHGNVSGGAKCICNWHKNQLFSITFECHIVCWWLLAAKRIERNWDDDRWGHPLSLKKNLNFMKPWTSTLKIISETLFSFLDVNCLFFAFDKYCNSEKKIFP